MRRLLTATCAAFLLLPAAAGADGLPAWAIGPFTRYDGNPILRPQGTGFEAGQAFNPGVVRVDGGYKMLYRGTTASQSQIGLATSSDGLHFERYAGNPVITRDRPEESAAVEDPRLFYLDGTYYTFYTAFDGRSTNLAEATSTDLVHWHKLGVIAPSTKNGAVVTDPYGRPVRLGGRYTMYVGQLEDFSVWTSPDMAHWTKKGPITLGYGTAGQPDEVCVAVTHYPTRDGRIGDDIVLFTAGKLFPTGSWFYAISEALYSSQDPTKQLDRLPDAVFKPAESYELTGFTPNTVFMNSILFNGREWMMHYGAADTVIAVATAPAKLPADAQTAAVAGPASSPPLRFARRRLSGGRLRLRLSGGTTGSVRQVRFYVGSKVVGVDRRAPFAVTVRAPRGRPTLELRAVVAFADGSRRTLRRTL